MSNWNKKIIIFLTYCNRYVFWVASIAIPIIIANDKHTIMLFWGFSILILSLYNIIGTLLKWKHIYCTLQNISHQEMTPDKTEWDKFSFSDKYVIHIASCFFALVIFACYFLNIV